MIRKDKVRKRSRLRHVAPDAVFGRIHWTQSGRFFSVAGEATTVVKIIVPSPHIFVRIVAGETIDCPVALLEAGA